MALIRHRETARVLLQADSGAFLLLYTHWDPGSGLKPRWVIPGGGIEPNEPLELGASRELFEETGLWLETELIGPKIAELAFHQDWETGDWETGIAHIFYHRIQQEIEISKTNWTEEEHRDILETRWWQIDELIKSKQQVGPPGLIELMGELSQ